MYVKIWGAQKELKNAQKSGRFQINSKKKRELERAMTGAYALGAKGIMFVPKEGEKTMPRLVIRRSNDNEAQNEK